MKLIKDHPSLKIQKHTKKRFICPRQDRIDSLRRILMNAMDIYFSGDEFVLSDRVNLEKIQRKVIRELKIGDHSNISFQWNCAMKRWESFYYFREYVNISLQNFIHSN